jgi:Uma2 family endonuclease
MRATMNLNLAHEPISEEDYLQGELLAETKHEYIYGEVYAMAGASENHNFLSLNMASELRNHLKGTPCRTFMADMKVKVGSNFFIRT